MKIAEMFGTTQTTVSRALRNREPVKSKTLTPEEQADLIELVGEGCPLDELAAGFDCDVETLEYYVRKHRRAESRAKEREDRIVCGDKFSGMLLDRGGGEFHATFKNADGTFEHMDLHGCTRELAKDEYERWTAQMDRRDGDYQAVFNKPKEAVWLVMPETANMVPFTSEGAANTFAEQVQALTGVGMVVRMVTM